MSSFGRGRPPRGWSGLDTRRGRLQGTEDCPAGEAVREGTLEKREAQVNGQDPRRFPRARATWPAIVESADGRVVSAEVVDVSLSGMKVKTDSEAAVGPPVTPR